ncbi:MarR family winged helix-turn-helix transcriptional regulator [Microbacterium sp.]|uniref:MarR family winged helix-turn-helix transcriptional regulator n=1 Tax=Microbacterium sp. TaxID=51671 RepID=UPI0039E4CE9F
MNTTENTSKNTSEPRTPRPLGYWLKATDRLMAAEFDAAFAHEGVNRRDWRLLNVVDGTVEATRPLHPRKLAGLIERGWVAPEGDGWTLTDEGRAAKTRLAELAENIRARVTDAVSPDDLDTTLRTLEQIARAFGWDENTPLPRRAAHRSRRGAGRDFGDGRRNGFGERHGFGDRNGFGQRHGFGDGYPLPGRDGFGPASFADDADQRHDGHRRRDPQRRFVRLAQHAYERGFDAGFTRGRDA